MTASITDRQMALYAALAISVHLLESGIPSPVPGIKPGLANVITLIVLWRHGLRAAIWVTALRVMGASLLLGTLLSPTFILSVAGAVGALAALAVLHLTLRSVLGPVGFAIPAAMAHIACQLVVAWVFYVPHPGLWSIAPVLLAFAIVAGTATGIITVAINTRLSARPDVR